ncbi:MAG: TIGR02186 family protein [Candidatus Dojkabacteria bacterium]
MFNTKLLFLIFIFGVLCLIASTVKINAATSDSEVSTTTSGLSVKVGPGDPLPVSVKLSNFGSGKRVDVLLEYEVFNSNGERIYLGNETVAVETTNSFVKTIQIPVNTAEGIYTVRTNITYTGQVVPAKSEFTFQVENKIFGLFKSDLIIYAVITTIIGIVMGIIGYFLVNKNKSARISPINYHEIPYEQRVFYELTSDTVMAMRQKIGDSAIEIASGISGLEIEQETGKVLALNEKPSKIIAELVAEYEVLGKNVSFSFRKK